MHLPSPPLARLRRLPVLVLCLAAGLGATSAQTVERISTSGGGAQSDGPSSRPAISSDGGRVAFYSEATNLVPGDTNAVRDIFVKDTTSGAIVRVSVSSAGVQGDGKSSRPVITADGRYVAFYSDSTNLVPGDVNGTRDIFVRDTLTSTTVLISKSSAGGLSNGESSRPAISDDGRYVAFRSLGSNLVVGDVNLAMDVFLHDRDTDGDGIYDEPGAFGTILISRSSAGVQGDGDSSVPAMSADGRYIAFRSVATNLVAGDTNGSRDVFVRDVQTGTTILVSKNVAGTIGNLDSSRPSISDDGRYVTFYSMAENLVLGDTNQHCFLDAFGQTICEPASDCFVHDRDADGDGIFDEPGATSIVRVSVATDGSQGNERSEDPILSGDGRYVTFWTEATNLFPGDTNGFLDVVLHDRDADGNGVFDEPGGISTVLINQSTGGAQGNGDSKRAVLNDDGSMIAFRGNGDNLVPGDTNAAEDVFLWTAPAACDEIFYGTSTPACSGSQEIDIDGCLVENSAGLLTCTNAPPLTAGLLVIGLGSFPPGLPALGITAYINPAAPYFTFNAAADAGGNGSAPIFVPAPSAGVTVYGQFVWFNTPACGGAGFSASNAVQTTILP